MTVVLKFKQPSFEALYHLGMDTAVILDEKSDSCGDQSRRHRTLQALLLGKGLGRSRSISGTAIATRRRSRSHTATFRFISDPSAAVAAMLAGDVDAFPRFANVQALDQFRSDPRFQVLVGGSEGKTILGINNKKKAAR